jgi:hypothetical protein
VLVRPLYLILLELNSYLPIRARDSRSKSLYLHDTQTGVVTYLEIRFAPTLVVKDDVGLSELNTYLDAPAFSHTF